jgi:hypothetical protein
MLTIADVRTAVTQGERKRAMEMLKLILAENPSAEAWYVAARLSKDKSNALKYLRRALLIDSHHTKSLELMEKLGGKPKGFWGSIGEEIADAIHGQAKKSPLLKHLNPRHQLIAVGLMTVVIIIGFIFAFSSFFKPAEGLYVPEVAPDAAPTLRLNSNQVVDNFVANGYDLNGLRKSNRAGTAAGQTIIFNLADSYGNWHVITVRVYHDLSALISDQENLNAQEESSNVVPVSNAILIYPKSLQGYAANRLVNTFNLLAAS